MRTPQHRMLACKLAYDEGISAAAVVTRPHCYGLSREEREVGDWRVVSVGRHPIDRTARMVYAHGPHTSFRVRLGGLPAVGGLVMGGVAFSDDPNEVQVAAGVTMHVPGSWEAIAAGVLPGGLFPKAGATLPVRVGWHVAGEAPNVRLLQCHVHAIGHDAFLVQALGDGVRDEGGSVLASTTAPAFEAGDTMTLGVPWVSEHGELLLTFDVSHLRAAALAVVEAAVTG